MVRRMAVEFGTRPEELLVAIGPSIGACCYEVDEAVRQEFAVQEALDPDSFFYRAPREKYRLDLWEANRRILIQAGVLPEHITTAGICTQCNSRLLWSHRATGGRRGGLAAFSACFPRRKKMEIKACRLCPRLCGAPRTAQEGEGFCKMGADAVVARAALHFWEEPCLSGTRGSGAVFFTGCSLGCVFCQNEQISTRREVGKRLDPEELSEVFLRLEEQGAHNINLVNPTHFAPAIAQALRLRRPSVPVVYNSGGYDRVETLRSLEGLIDIYLPDLKYVSPTLSLRYSGAENYPEAAKATILEMLRQTGPPALDEAGMMQKGTIVRHLVLPSNTRSTSEGFPGCPSFQRAVYWSA